MHYNVLLIFTLSHRTALTAKQLFMELIRWITKKDNSPCDSLPFALKATMSGQAFAKSTPSERTRSSIIV